MIFSLSHTHRTIKFKEARNQTNKNKKMMKVSTNDKEDTYIYIT